jgi:trans-feruloyl-CoA hydratase/vanillin synthase
VETKEFKTVKVEKDDGITWCILNRPEKRNAMNPQLHYDMLDALTELEVDKDTKVLVITGAGPSWCAGQDLREYFRGTDNNPLERRKASWASQEWRWRRLFTFPSRPSPWSMVSASAARSSAHRLRLRYCSRRRDLGLSEINWGIFPGGLVSRV